jgi:uncharacterized protein YoxC
MEVLMNLNTIINISTILIAVGSVFYSIVTRLNHMKHMSDAIEELKKDFKTHKEGVWNRLNDLSHDVTEIQSKCAERHK